MNHRHLTEEQLVSLSAAEALPAECAVCPECLARRHSVARTLREVADVASITVDAHFPPERLARQRARILARIERYGQRARVLTFPAQPRSFGRVRSGEGLPPPRLPASSSVWSRGEPCTTFRRFTYRCDSTSPPPPFRCRCARRATRSATRSSCGR